MGSNIVSEMDFDDLAEKSVTDCTESDILAADVFNSNGYKLLSVNTVITDYIKIHLGFNGIRTIRVYKTIKSETRNSGFSDCFIKNYGETVCSVKKIITSLSAGHALDYDEIIKISENMVENTDISSCYIVKNMSHLKSVDEYTYTHSVNVAFYSMLMAKWLGLPVEEISLAVQSGLLHDIGKVEIPPSILKKKGPLTENEFSIIKTHPLHGYELLSECSNMDMQIKEVALLHHERLNGSGYPKGITSISLLARIVSIADVYDAMTSDRVYKKGVTPFKAFEFFLQKGISLFDWHILNVFITNMSAFLVGSTVEFTSGLKARIVYIPPDKPLRPIACIDSNFFDFSAADDIERIV